MQLDAKLNKSLDRNVVFTVEDVIEMIFDQCCIPACRVYDPDAGQDLSSSHQHLPLVGSQPDITVPLRHLLQA
jgi:hypothetical protein